MSAYEIIKAFPGASKHTSRVGTKAGTADDLYEADRKVKRLREDGSAAWARDVQTGEQFDPAEKLNMRPRTDIRACPQCGEDMDHPSQLGRHEPGDVMTGGCRMRKKNPSARRGGIQTMEDFGDFGSIFTARDKIDDDDSSFHWSNLEAVSERHRLEPTDFLVPNHLEGGDYSGGGSVNKANQLSFLEEFGNEPGVHSLYGSHGSYGVAIRIGALTEAMTDVLSGLEDYGIMDEGKLSEVEHEAEEEAWENWVRSDFTRELRRAHPDQEDNIDEMEEEDLAKIFLHFAGKSNTYWNHGSSEGATIDIKRIVNAVDEDLFSDPERWEGWPA